MTTFLVLPNGAAADRVLLAPDANTVLPNSLKGELWLTPYRRNGNYTWLQYTLPQGIEMEAQRIDLLPERRALTQLNLEYPLLIDFRQVPAVALGVRDVLGTGSDHRSFYLVAAKALSLSNRQQRLVRELQISGGFGTERMNGLFLGIKARLTLGVTLAAEVYRNRPNVSLALPVARGLLARVTSLNGTVFYGMAFTLVR